MRDEYLARKYLEAFLPITLDASRITVIMPYDTLIAALLEEGHAKRTEVLRKAKAEADRLIEDAKAAAEALTSDADSRVRQEVARRRTEILGRAALSARRILLETKHEVLETVWGRATETALGLAGADRAAVLRTLLDELLVAAPPGQITVRLDGRNQPSLEPLLTEKGIPFETQPRDDLVLGVELVAGGECLKSSLATRLAKAKPGLVIELNRLLFQVANS